MGYSERANPNSEWNRRRGLGKKSTPVVPVDDISSDVWNKSLWQIIWQKILSFFKGR